MVNKNILIVEPDDFFRNVLSDSIVRAGYSVDVATSVAELYAKASTKRPDLILLSLVLPDGSGFNVLRDLPTRIGPVPVIVVSASGDPTEINQARAIGIREYLIKEIFDPTEVVEKVSKVINAPLVPVSHQEDAPSVPEFQVGDDAGVTELDLDDVPVAPATTQQSSATPSASSAPSGKRGNGEDILIVEDDKFLREMFVRKLTAEGFKVNQAEDGPTAIKMLNTLMPRIILLDLVLPGMDGFEILTEIRKNARFKTVPVMIVSNLGQKEDVDKAIRLGATDFLVKANFTLEEIAARISELIVKGA